MNRILIAFAGVLLCCLNAHAADPIKGQALLIGIQNYTKVSTLSGVGADTRLLEETLVEQGGYQVKRINDSAAADDSMMSLKSERERLQHAVKAWLDARTPDETVLLYFSGHGFRDEEDRLYLAARDCDPKSPQPGGISIAWLRQRLVACPAKMKLLVLDACHAGSARSAARGVTVEAKELTDFFGSIEGLVTLASCTGQQQSYLWPAKGQSLFTYWLAQGLSGHADREPFGRITVNELETFVKGKVRRSAEAVHSAVQTPTRLQGPGVTEDVILQMRPISYKRLIDNLAEQMDALIRLEGIKRVGVVPQFDHDVAGDLLERDYGLWTSNAPAELANLLADKSQGDYRVLAVNAVRELLQKKKITSKDIGTDKSKNIKIEGGNLPALIGGRIESLPAQTIALRCTLVNLTDQANLGSAAGTALLSGAEPGMNGVSGLAQPAAETDDPKVAAEFRPVSIDAKAKHPLDDPTFPYRVRIVVKDAGDELSYRQLTFDGNHCHVALREGEVFHINITNNSGNPAFARVLVDGLNTLPEKSRVKGVYIEPRTDDSHGEYRQAQPVNLAEAQAWGPLEPGLEYGFTGFYLETGEDAVYDEFKLVDAQRSFASQAGYTDQLGIITVAFFDLLKKPPPPPPPPTAGSRGVRSGVGSGGRHDTKTDTYDGDYIPGRMLAVMHIWYGE